MTGLNVRRSIRQYLGSRVWYTERDRSGRTTSAGSNRSRSPRLLDRPLVADSGPP